MQVPGAARQQVLACIVLSLRFDVQRLAVLLRNPKKRCGICEAASPQGARGGYTARIEILEELSP
jgi:hypothetical protein